MWFLLFIKFSFLKQVYLTILSMHIKLCVVTNYKKIGIKFSFLKHVYLRILSMHIKLCVVTNYKKIGITISNYLKKLESQ